MAKERTKGKGRRRATKGTREIARVRALARTRSRAKARARAKKGKGMDK